VKKATPANYKKDQLYPKVAGAVAELMQADKIVSPVEVLITMQRLERRQYEDWRFGRIAYLERVLVGNLSKANRILRILRLHAEALQLTPSWTAYCRWGKRGRRARLRFSKHGDPNVERAYAMHYLTREQQRQTSRKDSTKDRDMACDAVEASF